MNIVCKRDIENNIFSTILSIKDFGTGSMTAEQEEEMLNDYPIKLEYKDLTFNGKFTVTDGIPIITDEVDGEEVTLSINNKELLIDKNFVATYRIDSNKVTAGEIKTKLNTKELVAQSKCILFETTIKKEITKMLVLSRGKVNKFFDEIEENI